MVEHIPDQKAIIKRTIIWPFIATILCLVFSVVFWFVWIFMLSGEYLEIPMGLGGQIYPVLFAKPVLFSALFYEFLIGPVLEYQEVSMKTRVKLTVWVPFTIIAVLLIIFCPMDDNRPYWKAFFDAAIGKL